MLKEGRWGGGLQLNIFLRVGPPPLKSVGFIGKGRGDDRGGGAVNGLPTVWPLGRQIGVNGR